MRERSRHNNGDILLINHSDGNSIWWPLGTPYENKINSGNDGEATLKIMSDKLLRKGSLGAKSVC